MPLSERAVFYWPIRLDDALTHDENTISEVLVFTDVEGDHEAIAYTSSLGYGDWGADGIPWNLCSSGGNRGTIAQRTGTYGHG